VAHLSDAELCTGDLRHATGAAVYDRLARAAKRWRGFGDFWGHVLVAQGSMDAMVELADLAVWDVAAPKLIVEEAGGRATSPGGDAGARSGPLVCTNGVVHDEVLALLAAE
jgi:histidinol-phosphatase